MDRLDLRRQHRDDHHAYLRRHRDVIRMAGATMDEAADVYSGGLWVVEGVTRQQARALAEASPFFVTGVHVGCEVLWWGSAPGFEAVTIDGVEQD